MLTVLFSSFNGEASLPLMLKRLAEIEAPPGGWKIVAVDNGSTDATGGILRSWLSKLPIEVMYEPVSGKNRALNTGLAGVEGDVVVLTDDDVLPDPSWLVRYRALADAKPDYDIFGGPILPAWEVEPPAHIRNSSLLGPIFAVKSPALEGAVHPSGPNMAVRSRIFAAGFRFDEAMGPRQGASYPMGSETEFIVRLEQAGYRSWFSHGPKVAHLVPKRHIEREWIMKRARRLGRGQARMSLAQTENRDRTEHLFGAPRWLLRAIAETALKWSLAQATGNRVQVFETAWQINALLGQMMEWRTAGRMAEAGQGSLRKTARKRSSPDCASE